MATTYAQRRELFQQVCDRTVERIRTEHEAYSSKIAGWFRNQWQRLMAPTTSRETAATGAGLAGDIIAFFAKNLPLIGPAVSRAATGVASIVKRKLLESGIEVTNDPTERFQITGAFMLEHGMQAYLDAIRKADQAATDYSRTAVGNCAGFLERVYRFYYWKYRLDRLRYYHGLLLEHCLQVDDSLTEAERSWRELDRDLKLNGPKLFEDWTWHSTNCKDTCVFPWNTLEISAPTLTGHRPVFVPGPNAGRPVPVVPTSAPPPLPPRTHPKHLKLK